MNSVTDGVSFGLMYLRSGEDIQQEIIFRPKHDPDKPPPRKPGDAIVVWGMMIGVVLGGTLGVLLEALWGIGSLYLNVPFGAIGFGIVGALVGERIQKARWKS